MSSPHESAAAHVEPAFTARADEQVRDVLVRLASPEAHTVEVVFAVDAAERLVGVATVSALLRAEPGATVASAVTSTPTCMHLGMDQERVALHAVRHGLSFVPIEDGAGRFVGVVSAPALLAILHSEHVEDLHRLAGIRSETRQAVHALDGPPLRRARHRLPWLVVGLAGSAFAAWVMASFERTLQSQLAVAFFIPGVVYLADAIGTQTEAIAVRFLSLGQGSFRKVLLGEARTGLFIGVALALLAFPSVALAMGDVRLAAAVALSVIVAGTVASTVGLLFPWALARLGRDPAFGSGPIATIVQDVLSLVVYFAFVRAFSPLP